MYLSYLSAFAAIFLMEWLLIAAWLSTSDNSWLYYLGAAFVILFWGQPWASRDPYRTHSNGSRNAGYIGLLFFSLISLVTFEPLTPPHYSIFESLIFLEILVLFIVELSGRKPRG